MKKKISLVALALMAVALGCSLTQFCSCASQTAADMSALDDYRAALKRADSGETVPPDSALEKKAIEKVQQLLSEFTAENIGGRVSAVYADDVFFNDTLKTLRGPEEIEQYFLETAESLKSSAVRFTDVARSGPNYYLRWEMTYESRVINKGNDIRTIGMTHLRFDSEGKVVVHQDFWDSTRGVFEHIPVVGPGIRLVKKRL